MRGSGLLLVAALAGCGGVTSLDVTVTFDDLQHHPQSLRVTLVAAGAPIRTNVPVTVPGRSIRSGDDFVIALDDSLGGQQVTVEIAAIENNATTIRGQATRTVVAHQESPLDVTLGTANTDGGMPNGCTPGCAMGVETTCSDGAASTRACQFGCAAGKCNLGDSCGAPGDVSAGGTFSGTFDGIGDGHAGSCGGMGGPDLVTRAVLGDWTTVTVDADGTAFPPVLYTFTGCADPTTQIPLAGPCAGAVVDPTATACASGNGARLVECGLPPGTYFTFLDTTMPTTAAYNLDVKLERATLDSCPAAGNLLRGGSYSIDLSKRKDSFTSSGGCADNGAGSNDAIFFFALAAKHNVTVSTSTSGAGFLHTVYLRSACAGPQIGCVQTVRKQDGTTQTLQGLNPGIYFVIVDGAGQTAGGVVQLTLAIQ